MYRLGSVKYRLNFTKAEHSGSPFSTAISIATYALSIALGSLMGQKFTAP